MSNKVQVAWFLGKTSLNEVQLRNMVLKWSSKRMTKPELYTKPVGRLKWTLLSQHISCMFCKDSGQPPKYQFLFWIPWEKQNFWLTLVEDSTVWEQGKKDSLRCDKQYEFVFFLMCNCFLNYKVFPQNGRYHLSIQATLQF